MIKRGSHNHYFGPKKFGQSIPACISGVLATTASPCPWLEKHGKRLALKTKKNISKAKMVQFRVKNRLLVVDKTSHRKTSCPIG